MLACKPEIANLLRRGRPASWAPRAPAWPSSGPRFSSDVAGDGPPKGSRHRQCDRTADLDIEAGFDPRTVQRRRAAFAALEVWLRDVLDCRIEVLALSGFLLGLALKAFGMHLFRSGAPQYHFEDCINAVTDRFLHWRLHYTAAWRLLRRWRELEPGRCRVVLPAALMRAMVSLALLWGWTRWTALTLLGFAAMLHPTEFLTATRRNLMLPSDMRMPGADGFIHIDRPKTRRFARMQHGRISDQAVLAVLELVFGPLGMTEKLAPYSAMAYRRRWDSLLHFLGVPTGSTAPGPTPGGLRGSGATFFYIVIEDVAKVHWRGRWRRLETVELYLQEVAASTLLNHLRPDARAMVFAYADLADAVLSAFLASGSEAEWACRRQRVSATSLHALQRRVPAVASHCRPLSLPGVD